MARSRLWIILTVSLVLATAGSGALSATVDFWFAKAGDATGTPISSINVAPGATFNLSIWYKTDDVWTHNALELLIGYDRSIAQGTAAVATDGQVVSSGGVSNISLPITLANNTGGAYSSTTGLRPYGAHLALGAGLGTTVNAFAASRVADISLKNQAIPLGGSYNIVIWNAGSGNYWTTFVPMMDIIRRQLSAGALTVNSSYDASNSPIVQAKKADENAEVQLVGQTVTAAFRDSFGPVAFAIEDATRASGVRVLSNAAVSPGDIVTIDGYAITMSGERVIDGISGTVLPISSGNPIPAPFAMTGLSSGGGAYGKQSAVVNIAPATMSPGLGNVGLLMRLCGKVTYVRNFGSYSSYFYVDDGSGLSDGSGYAGLRCRAWGAGSSPNALPVVGSYVEVTGVMGVTQVNGISARFLWTSAVRTIP